MAIILDEKTGVTVVTELYAPDIRIKGNPVDRTAGSVHMELSRLEYHDGAFVRMDPVGSVAESVGAFAARSFEVNGKVATGLDVVAVVEKYVAVLHAESQQAAGGSEGGSAGGSPA